MLVSSQIVPGAGWDLLHDMLSFLRAVFKRLSNSLLQPITTGANSAMNQAEFLMIFAKNGVLLNLVLYLIG